MIWYEKGYKLNNLGGYEKANDYYRRVIIATNNYAVRYNLGNVYFKLA